MEGDEESGGIGESLSSPGIEDDVVPPKDTQADMFTCPALHIVSPIHTHFIR